MIRTYLMLSNTAYHIQIFRIIGLEQMLYSNNRIIFAVFILSIIIPIKILMIRTCGMLYNNAIICV
jgi:hypothetical protein